MWAKSAALAETELVGGYAVALTLMWHRARKLSLSKGGGLGSESPMQVSWRWIAKHIVFI